jgi:hypothetical protein
LSAADTQNLGRRGPQVLEVFLLPRPPRRLFPDNVRVATSLDNGGDARAEVGLDVLEPGLAALVLDRVVEQRRDRLVLVAAVLDHQGRDPE